MIFINSKYRTNKKFTGVDNVALAYTEFLKEYYKVKEINYQHSSTLKKNIEEQLFIQGKKIKQNDIIIHPTNTAPIRKLKGTEILVLHDLAFIDYPSGFNNLFRKWYHFLIPKLIKSKNHIITVSEFSKKRISEYYKVKADKISVVPNGIDTLKVGLDFTTFEPKHFLSVGSITERKNHLTIIQAHKMLPTNVRKKYPLKIIGGRSNYFNEGDFSKQIDEHIHMLGYVGFSELQKLYIESLAFISASHYEGFGLPIIEALSYGKHILCSDIPPYKEILGNNYDYLFSPNDQIKLAEMMEFIASNDQLFFREKKLIQQRFNIAENYLWKNTLLKLDEVITRFSEANNES